MESFAYRLQRLESGVVLLDRDARILALNPTAERLLGRPAAELIGREIAEVHPPAARAKLAWLLEAAQTEESVALTAALPGRMLMLKATRLPPAGVCLTLTPIDGASTSPPPATPEEAPPPLLKLPLSRGGGVTLTPLDDVAYLRADGHYTTAATLSGDDGFCPLGLAELETRLDGVGFMRVHRSYIVNLRHVVAVKREDGRVTLTTAARNAPETPVGRAKVEAIRRLFAVV
jgi:LytTR family transcriptional regulator, CO-responsive transcriptional regulator RcoM